MDRSVSTSSQAKTMIEHGARRGQGTDQAPQMHAFVDDMNNLLMSMCAASELAQRPDVKPASLASYLAIISKTSVLASALTRQLPTILQDQRPAQQEFCVIQTVRAIAPLARLLAGGQIAVSTSFPKSPHRVCASAQHFEAALVNLILKARDSMPRGGLLDLRVQTSGQIVEISVTDTGSGMTPEHMLRIFDPFYSTTFECAGLGLDLAQVSRFASEAGGQVKVKSAIGRGTTFTISLPRISDRDAANPLPGTISTNDCPKRILATGRIANLISRAGGSSNTERNTSHA